MCHSRWVIYQNRIGRMPKRLCWDMWWWLKWGWILRICLLSRNWILWSWRKKWGIGMASMLGSVYSGRQMIEFIFNLPFQYFMFLLHIPCIFETVLDIELWARCDRAIFGRLTRRRRFEVTLLSSLLINKCRRHLRWVLLINRSWFIHANLSAKSVIEVGLLRPLWRPSATGEIFEDGDEDLVLHSVQFITWVFGYCYI